MVPISITVHAAGLKTPRTYKMEFVSDRTLAPLLAQRAIYSALDGTERTLGPGSVTVRGAMELEGGLPPVRLDNVYSADSNAIAQAAVYSTIPLSFLAQSGLDGIRPKSISLDFETSDHRNQLQVDQVWPSNREVHPGETLELNISLTGENGGEIIKKVKYQVPVGAPLGTLLVTVSDAMTANLVEFSASRRRTQPHSGADRQAGEFVARVQSALGALISIRTQLSGAGCGSARSASVGGAPAGKIATHRGGADHGPGSESRRIRD